MKRYYVQQRIMNLSNAKTETTYVELKTHQPIALAKNIIINSAPQPTGLAQMFRKAESKLLSGEKDQADFKDSQVFKYLDMLGLSEKYGDAFADANIHDEKALKKLNLFSLM
jgi:hypothetical protein